MEECLPILPQIIGSDPTWWSGPDEGHRLALHNKIAMMNNSSIDLKILKNSSLGFIEEVKIDEEENEKQTKSYVEKINSITDEHRLQIVEDLGLNTNPVLKENPEIKKKAIALVTEFADIFGEKGKKEIGITDMIDIKIDLKKGARPIKQKV